MHGLQAKTHSSSLFTLVGLQRAQVYMILLLSPLLNGQGACLTMLVIPFAASSLQRPSRSKISKKKLSRVKNSYSTWTKWHQSILCWSHGTSGPRSSSPSCFSPLLLIFSRYVISCLRSSSHRTDIAVWIASLCLAL